ncbi:uncharacterized protein LOC122061377 [Macadamia integrifolia]|uniref:uncharacterized protein LOC122061377 n=1 Tax=Macadamia integrifolia TaxID=60698 RepID=UPI001C5288DA|nr:uncharacterized protein LOC122061377 [Macadamia integrifolia]
MGREEIKAYLTARPTEWYLEERKRKSIEGHEGRTDRYYWNYLERTFFRSLKEVERYIETGVLPKPLPKIKKPRLEANNQMQGFSADNSKGKPSQSLTASSSISSEQLLLMAPVAVKPQEKRKRLPTAYNLFLKEEIQRVKATYPDILHKEAFKIAAKNWAAQNVPPAGSTPDNNKNGNKLNGSEDVDVCDEPDAGAVVAAEVNTSKASSGSDDDTEDGDETVAEAVVAPEANTSEAGSGSDDDDDARWEVRYREGFGGRRR